jgi:LysM repeat protein
MRNKILFVLFVCIGVVVVTSTPVYCQDSVSTVRSQIVETLQGKQYYIHFVKDGQTLFGIAKTYGITPDDLIANNPDLKTGIHTDMILKIPYLDQSKGQEKQQSSVFKKKNKTNVVSNESISTEAIDQNQYYYEIKKGETIYGIAKKYNLELEDLLKANPGVTTFDRGQKLKIPGRKADGSLLSKALDNSNKSVTSKSFDESSQTQNRIDDIDAPVRYHKVKAKETLYGISKTYHVSIDDLMAMNPQVNNGVKKDMILIIPPLPVSEKPAPKNRTNTIADVTMPVVTTEPPVREKNGQFKVAMLIPFYLDDLDSLRLDQSDPKVFNFVQYYESALLAVNLLKKDGLNVKLSVYDVDGDAKIDKTRKVLAKKEMANMDLIIGPFYPKGFDLASKFAGEHKIPIVNPLSKRNEILVGKPWVFKVQPGSAGQMYEVAGFVNSHFPDANIVLVRTSRIKFAAEADIFKEQMQSFLARQNTLRRYKEVLFASEGINGIRSKLSDTKPNLLIVLSDEEAVVSDMLQKIDEIRGSNDLTVLGMGSWEQFKLDVKIMSNLNLYLYSNKLVDFSEDQIKNYTSDFQKEYNTVPEVKKYGFDGFDITYFFLSSLMKYGPYFEKQFMNYEYKGLQNSFHFRKTPTGGYENMGVNFYKYENYNLKRVQ